MSGEDILGVFIMFACGWGCGALFYGIGVWADRRKDPMHFWAGTEILPEKIRDIPAYNHENAKMWKNYSLWFWIAGVFGVIGVWNDIAAVLCLVLLVLSCTLGLLLLIRRYRKIWNQFSQNA